MYLQNYLYSDNISFWIRAKLQYDLKTKNNIECHMDIKMNLVYFPTKIYTWISIFESPYIFITIRLSKITITS